jgi:hypothetical protein
MKRLPCAIEVKIHQIKGLAERADRGQEETLDLRSRLQVCSSPLARIGNAANQTAAEHGDWENPETSGNPDVRSFLYRA